ncbi:hypothetical protein KR51_00032660 [Rubidibacter lacunae KORDI 51-2]|uniref:Uncharacterized protein n=1 Tax=Rubidibacter lacunae KORDI 51-2 TaxID=582515 RepID=U5D6N0_9CHRO|nr:YaaW family protein [Rubidibacter lacunae]ERN40318.1 hypothetical protein KR51_00032660 [Rubidibacter lacunae KORDI 51-2]
MYELRAALELANCEELQQITQILFCRKFNPLDYFAMPAPEELQQRDRSAWLDAIEERFRFLAADGVAILRRQTDALTYRQVLMRVCKYLKIPVATDLGTVDLEAEVFLNLVEKAWQRLPAAERRSTLFRVRRSLARAQAPEPLPPQLEHNPFDIALKGGSAIAVSSLLRSWLLRETARQFALHFATYQTARAAIAHGGAAAAAHLQSQVALRAAQRGMIANAARYGAVRTTFAVLGPALWGWFLADLGWRAIATNYSRVIPTVFALAQIRLTREACWQPVPAN